MEAMSEQERFEQGCLPRELELPRHLVEYLAELSLKEQID